MPSTAILRNLYRETIAETCCRIFFLDTYDQGSNDYFTEEQINGSNRKKNYVQKFINLIWLYLLPAGCRF